MPPTPNSRLTATRMALLYLIMRMDFDGTGATKSEITEGLPARTAASRWKMIDQLFDDGYLFKSWPQHGAVRYHLDAQGFHALSPAGLGVKVGRRHD